MHRAHVGLWPGAADDLSLKRSSRVKENHALVGLSMRGTRPMLNTSCNHRQQRSARLAMGVVLASSIASPVVGQQMQWGFDFTTGNVSTINNDGTGGANLGGQPIGTRGIPTYSNDIPPANRRQNTTVASYTPPPPCNCGACGSPRAAATRPYSSNRSLLQRAFPRQVRLVRLVRRVRPRHSRLAL